jgi:hypothetical protein
MQKNGTRLYVSIQNDVQLLEDVLHKVHAGAASLLTTSVSQQQLLLYMSCLVQQNPSRCNVVPQAQKAY